jgi:dual specificity phosphatase 12
MEMNAQMIIDRLWLGSIDSTYDSCQLEYMKITHVLTVMEDIHTTRSMVERMVKIHHIPIGDHVNAPICTYFIEAIKFIQEALENGGSVYVHCYAGISRSPTIIAAYLIKTHSMDVEKALELIRSRRPCADPNPGFMKALRLWATVGSQS